ncbi:DUF3291 domain-containing protein [Salipiger sp. IMCC34102]|uniref:DUF3291 domain-containing protein n=1 Tax=Salipiger sp. IMCC34102 TaxID=2510647 RepID=UPI00101D63CE|nr:DUF3291 domain-containing protein [Salipiger sp. IMCC34102]RYH03274.1 DUF3291 domain-containing protein [Salipiger sp. IMCC34102]
MPLAELNFGTLRYPWDDPRIADFQNALDWVNLLAQRSDGFVWMLDGESMFEAQTELSGAFALRPNTASTLLVWRDADSLWSFVHKTVHAKFLARSAEWFVPDDSGHLVIWTVPQDHRPDLAEGLARWRALEQAGETAETFGARGLLKRVKDPRAGRATAP